MNKIFFTLFVIAAYAAGAMAQLQYVTPSDCASHGYIWCSSTGICQSDSCSSSGRKPSDYTTERSCTAAGYQWCSNTCIDSGISCDTVKGLAIGLMIAIIVIPILCCAGCGLAIYYCYYKPQQQKKNQMLQQQQYQQQHQHQAYQAPGQNIQYVQPGQRY